MDRLRCIEVFLQVAGGRSFSGAARHLGMSKGNVTKHVAWLERALGARLLARTTKSVSLTEAGLTFLENGRDLLSRLEEIEASVRLSVSEPRGVIRVGSPPSFGSYHLVPVVAAFTAQHPDIQVALCLDDGAANLVEEGLDLSVRICASLKDAGFIAQTLARVPQVLVASRSYLSASGTPTEVADLARHNCLVHSIKAPTSIWSFNGPRGKVSVRVRGSMRSNFGDALRYAAILGHGISMHPTYMVADDLASGKIELVLPEFEPTGLDIYAVFPSRRNLPVRVSTFLRFLRDWFSRPPDWAAPRYQPARAGPGTSARKRRNASVSLPTAP